MQCQFQKNFWKALMAHSKHKQMGMGGALLVLGVTLD